MTENHTLKYSFEKARFNLSRNLSLLSTIMLYTIGVIYLFENDITAYMLLIGGTILFAAYLLSTYTKKYRPYAILSLVLLSLLNIANLSIASNFHHIGDFFWVICVVTAGYFIMGKAWGIGLVIFNLLSIFTVFYMVRHGMISQIDKPYTTFSQINFLINLAIGGTLFSMLIIFFLKENKNIAQQYIDTNNKLEIMHEEKSIMLKEIHHRVKNNLQIITSLLRLQANDMKTPESTAHFQEAIDRISAIAKIHNQMYNSDGLNQISLKAYLDEMVNDLIFSYSEERKINTRIISNISAIHPKDLVPIALIFNELLTNSIKHAFKDRDEGLIIIEANINDDNSVSMIYSDDGEWIEPVKNYESIGMELIHSFVDQLDGTMNTDRSNGTTYTIEFTLTE